jgi:hypothetical protein
MQSQAAPAASKEHPMNVSTILARSASRRPTVRRARRLRGVLVALIVGGALASSAGTASATTVSWPTLGGSHDQNVSCDAYNHKLTVSPFAAPMWYYHSGQVVQAEVYLHDTRVTGWQTFPGHTLVRRVPVTYLGNPILGSSGTEADYEYPMSSLPTLTVTGMAGHSYQVYVYYTFYNEARQIVATDMHATSLYTSGYWGVSGTTWIPTSSTVSCTT